MHYSKRNRYQELPVTFKHTDHSHVFNTHAQHTLQCWLIEANLPRDQYICLTDSPFCDIISLYNCTYNSVAYPFEMDNIHIALVFVFE